MIARNGDNSSKNETRVGAMSPKRSKPLPQREYYVLGLTPFASSLISKKEDRGRSIYCYQTA